MDKAERAVELYDCGCNCSQSVLSAFIDEFDLDPQLALGIASTFGGGLAGTGNVCGAVTGALMVVGLRNGQATPGDQENRARTKEAGQRFLNAMKELHESLMCRDLLGYDVSTPEGSAAAKEAGVHDTVCRVIVRQAAEILREL